MVHPDLNYIQQLIENKIAESRTLEFKRGLWDSSESDKKEMLKDISALANTDGGRIIVGVAENESIITDIVGIDVSNIDATLTGLYQSIMGGIEPRINGINITPIQLENGKYILVFDIPKSWAAPHMVSFRNASRFYKRTSNNVYQLGVQEIRNEFLMAETIYEKIRRFRRERYDRIVNGDLPVKLEGSSFVVLHSIPVNSWMSNSDYSPKRKEVGINKRMPAMQELSTPRYTFDGYIEYSSTNSRTTKEYAQFFRNGSFELVTTRVFYQHSVHDNSYPAIRTPPLIDNLVNGVFRCLDYQTSLGCIPPFLLLLALINVKDYSLIINHFDDLKPTTENSLILPEIYIESVPESLGDTHEVLQNTFDQIWNAFGHEKYYQ